ncbi:unnamed protein product [Rotaria sp. Silwood2]|nr:unnamed protein product [Rotaria sp. Silwood2]
MGKCVSKQNSSKESSAKATDNYSNPKLEQFIAERPLHSCISLSCQPLNEQDMKIVIKEAIIKKQCRELVIQGDTLTPKYVSILTDGLRNNKTLKVLDLSRNPQMGDQGAELLANLLTPDEIFKQAKQISEELFIQPAAPRTYSRHHGRRLLDPEEFYRDQVFLPFQRELKVNVENRLSIFSQPRIQLLTQLRPQHITSTNCSIMELYKNLIEKFSDRLPQSLQLFGELERWKNACVNLMNKPNYVNIWMNDLLDKCDLVLYPNVHFLLIFLATLPVTTSSAERAFSSLKRIKTYCRSTMIENRLNGLAAAFIHKNVDIDAMRILDLFVQKHPRHLNFS